VRKSNFTFNSNGQMQLLRPDVSLTMQKQDAQKVPQRNILISSNQAQ